MAESVRAENVCNACSMRKKACDRTLPACGFCTNHNRACRYDITPRSKRGYRAYNPGRNFVAVDTLWPRSAPVHKDIITTNQSGLPSNPLNAHPPHCFKISPGFQSIGEVLNEQVHHILSLLDLTAEKVSDRYFRTSHQWHPIISRKLFDERALNTPPGGIPAPDIAVLILAMCLITPVQKLSSTSLALPLSRETLYTTTKSVFAQAQAALCSSMPLVQAMFLVASCEYASGRPEAAYISTCTCSGLAMVLGIQKGSLCISGDRTRSAGIGLREEEVERSSVALGIAMLETIIQAELDQGNLSPVADPAVCLLSVAEDEIPNITTSSCVLPPDTGWSGGQREAVLLLGKILRVSRIDGSMQSTRLLSDLTKLDIIVRGVLERVMSEECKWEIFMRSAVALCIRTLFLLHQTILDALQIPQSVDENQAVQRSRAALGTFCEMVIDSARCFSEELGPTPICCYYNIQAALKYLQGQPGDINGEALRSDIDYLLQTKRKYRDKWGF